MQKKEISKSISFTFSKFYSAQTSERECIKHFKIEFLTNIVTYEKHFLSGGCKFKNLCCKKDGRQRTSHNIYRMRRSQMRDTFSRFSNRFHVLWFRVWLTDSERNVPVGVFKAHVCLGDLLGISQLLHILNIWQRLSHGPLNTHRRFTFTSYKSQHPSTNFEFY